MKKALITQSNYIPWKGYFDAIAMTDVFVVYDDMQYTRRDWRNRNLIKTPQGLKWLTIPVEVKGKYFQKINDTVISDSNWNMDHWNMIKQNYSKAKCFDEMKEMVEFWYLTATSKYLTEVNIHFLKNICTFLNIDTEWRLSSEFQLAEEKTQRLVNICKEIKATDYYSGSAAK
ncbi:MAG: WbqC family protein, partial [Bacteroidia bacterium]|nr:WbqC family protein [Bacteroidia bacterium]